MASFSSFPIMIGNAVDGGNMEFPYIILLILWGSMVISLISYMKKLKLEISYLPKSPNRLKAMHISEGRAILEEVDLPGKLREKHVVLLVSSPTCHPCHEALTEFLELNERLDFPFACLVVAERFEYYEKFLNDYRGRVEIVPIYERTLKRLGINKFPTFLVVDENGIILREYLIVQFLLKFLEEKRLIQLRNTSNG